MDIRQLLRLARPEQWLKNLFVGLPLFFGGEIFNSWSIRQTLIAFLSFSLMASAVYCLNDIKDVKIDMSHPRKRYRPIASGRVSITQATMLMVCLAVASLTSCILLGRGHIENTCSVILFYGLLNVAYSYKLKQYAIIDVFTIALGFVLRLMAGGYACGIWLSPWIIMMTFLLTLFLAFAKRRDDVVIFQNTGNVTRNNTRRYNLEFLNQTLGILGAITIVCYMIYAVLM